ncbi:sensor histidine kinase [Luteimonas sp. e5]
MSPQRPYNTPIRFFALGDELRLYWLFRAVQGAAILVAFIGLGSILEQWSVVDAATGLVASAIYVISALLMVLLSFRHSIRTLGQFFLGSALDLAYANVVLYAAPGAVWPVAMLLISSVAGAAMFIHLRFGLLMALLGTLTLLLHRHWLPAEHTAELFSVRNMPPVLAVYFPVLLAFIAVILSRIGDKLFKHEHFARMRKDEIADLLALNEQILMRLPTGVLVIDEHGDIDLFNETARQLLQLGDGDRQSVALVAPELFRQWTRWRENREHESPPLMLGSELRQIEPRFLELNAEEHETLLFLEDTSQAERRAETITLATLGRFSASLAHEIRNPLSAIKYASQLLRESSNLDVMDRRMLDIVQQQIQRMNGIIESVLSLARRERTQPEIFDIRQMLRDFVDEYVAGFPLDNDRLDLRVPDTVVMAHADPRQVHQILMVLVSNARYYGRMPDEPAEMILRLQQVGEAVQVDVIDHGPGISESGQKSLFRPFYTTSGHGTGLGLYIARELARSNDGDLQYLPRARGSCFRLGLPLAAASRANG